MTEAEAKTKWCPMVRASTREEDGNSSNRNVPLEGDILSTEKHHNPSYARCIGSECACWIFRTPEEGCCGLVG